MRKIGKLILGFVILYLYMILLKQIYSKLCIYLPEIIFGTWRSYIIYGLAATAIDAIFTLALYGIGWIMSHFYYPNFIKILGCFATVVSFALSEVHLWQFVNALYFASFWEYLWGVILTCFIAWLYIALAGFVFYFPQKNEH